MNTAKSSQLSTFSQNHILPPGVTLIAFLHAHRDTPICKLPAQIGVTRYHGRTYVECRS